MKIVFLSFYSGNIARGAETFVHELASRLAVKHDVTVYQGGPVFKGAKYKNIRVEIPIDWHQKDSRYTLKRRFFIDYWSLLLKTFTQTVFKDLREADVVIPVNGGWESFLCRLWTLVRRKKLIISGQSGPGWDDRINLFCFPDVFVATSEQQKDWAKAINPFVRVEKIPNGVDLNQFSPDVKPNKLNLPKPIIVCVAALEDSKRVDLAIRAVSRLETGSLLILGQGDKKDELEALGQQLLPGRFEILSVPHEKIASYLASANLATLVSKHEGSPISLLEALASGLPVVADDSPVKKETIGDAGLLIDPLNLDQYANALKEALETNWGDRPRTQAAKFSWDKIATRYEEVLAK